MVSALFIFHVFLPYLRVFAETILGCAVPFSWQNYVSRINMSTGVLSRYVGKRHENGDDNGNETEAKFNGPVDIAFDSDNQMYVLGRCRTHFL